MGCTTPGSSNNGILPILPDQQPHVVKYQQQFSKTSRISFPTKHHSRQDFLVICRENSCVQSWGYPPLKLTASLPLKIDGWKMKFRAFGMPCFSGALTVSFFLAGIMSHQKNPLTLHYTGCLIGILIMAYHNPHLTG